MMNLRSGYPFWLIKSGLPYDYAKLETNLKTDVVIMGGGISGAITAYHLAEAGVDCAIVDARTIGLGSTCASTSLLQYEIDVPLSEMAAQIGSENAVQAYRLCAASIGKLAKIASKVKFSEFKPNKSLYYAAYKKDIAFLQKEFDIRKKYDFDVELLDEEGIREYGFSAPMAILNKPAAEVNAYAFTHAILQYLVRKGLKVYDRSAVETIRHGRNGVHLTTANGSEIRGKKLVYATGYESLKYIDEKIADLQSTYAIISEHIAHEGTFWKDNVLLWNTADPYLYMRSTHDNRIIVGGRDEQFYNPSRRDKLIPAKTRGLVKDFNTVFPGIDFNPEFSWTGTFASTKDGLPYIGRYRKLPNSYFALGFGGNGITFSLVAAEIIRDAITGKKNEDARIFAFGR